MQTFSFKKMHLKILSANCLPFCPSLNVLRVYNLFLILLPEKYFILDHSDSYLAIYVHDKMTSSMQTAFSDMFPKCWKYLNFGILSIGTLGTNFSENLKSNSYIFIQENAFENNHLQNGENLARSQCFKIPCLMDSLGHNGFSDGVFLFQMVAGVSGRVVIMTGAKSNLTVRTQILMWVTVK